MPDMTARNLGAIAQDSPSAFRDGGRPSDAEADALDQAAQSGGKAGPAWVKQLRLLRKVTMAAAAIYLLVLTYSFPYTWDDWAWGSSAGMQRLESGFRNYNGRYVSNLLVMAMTRSSIVKTLVMTIVLFAIVYLCSRLVSRHNDALFPLGFLLLLLVPKAVFAQAVAWTSGFANYAISALFILVFLFVNQAVLQRNRASFRGGRFAAITAASLAGSLVLENVTIFMVLASAALVVLVFIKSRQISWDNVAFLAGSVLGAIAMFSNGAYRNIADNQDSYRHVESGVAGVARLAVGNFEQVMSTNMVFNNLALNVILVCLLSVLIYRYVSGTGVSHGPVRKRVVWALLAVCLGYCVYAFVKLIYPGWRIVLDYTLAFEAVATLIFGASVAAIVGVCVEDIIRQRRLLFHMASAALMSAPLLVVSPIGPRNFFPSYVVGVLIVLELFDWLVTRDGLVMFASKAILICALVACIYQLSVFLYIAQLYNDRIDYERRAGAASSLVISFNLPYRTYLWQPNPKTTTDDRTSEYNEFYGISSGVTYVYVSYQEWTRDHKK